jgi:hypothetical protein
MLTQPGGGSALAIIGISVGTGVVALLFRGFGLTDGVLELGVARRLLRYLVRDREGNTTDIHNTSWLHRASNKEQTMAALGPG